ncbi:MAG: hypothetical protein AMJ55_07950 [Gammaproteobacteria bacterium SG8_15]|nr:MAG: hypothetical protein AMJ55_07950 [Gammaproteobacteria bacterium SG8_15]
MIISSQMSLQSWLDKPVNEYNDWPGAGIPMSTTEDRWLRSVSWQNKNQLNKACHISPVLPVVSFIKA